MNLISKWNLNDCAPELFIYKMSLTSPIFFNSYLAGLIEGASAPTFNRDGSIVVPKTERSSKGKLNYPSIQIIFQLTDFPVAQVIQKELGHGSITKKKQSAAYLLTINNTEGLIKVCNLINGKMRGPNYNQFILLTDYINNINTYKHIKPLSICKTSLGLDS
jgi:hypothetical protein